MAITDLDRAEFRKRLKSRRFNGLAYWEIFEPCQYEDVRPKRMAIVYGTYDQAVDYATETDPFLTRNGQVITEGQIVQLDVEVITPDPPPIKKLGRHEC